MLIITVQFLVR